MRVAIFGTQHYERNYFTIANKNNHHELVFFTENLNAATSHLAKGFVVVCTFVTDTLDTICITKLSKLGIQLIALRSAGYNNVALQAAQQHSIKVVRVPAYSPQAVAEHAVALLLTLNRKTHKAYNQGRENNFSLQHLMGFNLYQKTVGCIGTGKIGSAFCQIMLGFGCQVVAFDVAENDDLKQKGVCYTSFENLLTKSDIISIHCPLTPDTRYMFNKKVFDSMKKGAMLLNTSRGAIINSHDAINALKHQQLGYLGLDVYENEAELFFKDLSETILNDDCFTILQSFPNVLITPHQAFYTHEAVTEIAQITLQNITDFENKKQLINEITA